MRSPAPAGVPGEAPVPRGCGRGLIGVLVLALVAAGCGRQGAYYPGDGPPRAGRVDVASIPDARPRPEPLARTGNRPYHALGQMYAPLPSARGFRERGVASWYGRKFHGRRTSSGETYDMFAMTAAHRVLPLPTYVKVRHLGNGRSVVVKVNDRGPFVKNRVIDLSYAAAAKLGIDGAGTGPVEVIALDPKGEEWAGAPVAGVGTGSSASAARPFVQAGAFGQRANADALVERLRAQGYDRAHVTTTARADLTLYRVRIGPYRDPREAGRDLDRLARVLDGDPHLVVE